MSKYDDIINLEHYTSKNRPHMSMTNRAAQFMPFSALTGYSDAINEKGRLTSKKKLLDQDSRDSINNILYYINSNIDKNILVSITYFNKDLYKDGGSYNTIVDYIKKIDIYKETVIFKNNKSINMNDIISIEIVEDI